LIFIQAYTISNISTSSNFEQFYTQYTNDSISTYSIYLTRPNSRTGNIMYTDYYRSKSNLKPLVYSDKSKIKTTKNSNDSYTGKGTIYMYEDSDSTKRVTVGVNFITF
jgi:hypothetical protein